MCTAWSYGDIFWIEVPSLYQVDMDCQQSPNTPIAEGQGKCLTCLITVSLKMVSYQMIHSLYTSQYKTLLSPFTTMHSTQPVWFSPKATDMAVCQYLYSQISVTVALSCSVPWIRDRDENTYNRKVIYTKKPLDMQPWVVGPALPTDSPSLGFGLGSFLVLLSVNEGVTDSTETRLLRISSSSGRKDSRFTTVPMLDFCVSQGWDHAASCVCVCMSTVFFYTFFLFMEGRFFFLKPPIKTWICS